MTEIPNVSRTEMKIEPPLCEPVCEKSTDSAPIPTNGVPDGATADVVICSRCGVENPAGENVCASCKSFLPANQVARRTGVYATSQPVDIRGLAGDLVAGVTADLGGDLSTLQAAYVRRLGDVEVTLMLLTRDIADNGLLTPGGRVRDVYDRLLAGLATFDRLAQRLGTERKSRQVKSLAEVLRDEQ